MLDATVSSSIDSAIAEVGASLDGDSGAEGSEDTGTVLTEGAEGDGAAQGDEPVADDAPGDVESPVEAEGADAAAVAAAAAAAKTEQEAKPGEELPEGATLAKDRKGREILQFEKARGQRIYGAYKQQQELATKLNLPDGELPTPQHIEQLIEDRGLLDNLDLDVRTPDADSQARAVRYLLNSGKRAFESGLVGSNPHETMAAAILRATRDSAPEVFMGLQAQFESNAIEALYAQAQELGIGEGGAGRSLFNAAQHVEKALTGKFRTAADVASKGAKADPLAAKEAEIARREAAIRERDEREARNGWNAWQASVRDGANTEIQKAIDESMAPVVASLAKFPEEKKTLTVRLRAEVMDAIRSDPKWKPEMDRLYKQAEIAAAAERRDEFKASLLQRYAARARAILKEKAPAILSSMTARLAAANGSEHKRLAEGQKQRGSGQPGEPAKAQLPNGKPGNVKELHSEIDRIFQSF